jgi:hypothetical protein
VFEYTVFSTLYCGANHHGCGEYRVGAKDRRSNPNLASQPSLLKLERQLQDSTQPTGKEMEAIKKRLLMQAGICFAIFAALTALVMFSSRSHLGFFGNIATLVFGTVFTTIGVAVGDAIRRFVKPDVLFASSAIDIFRAKVFWMIGPQVIGWIIGFMAFNGFMEHTLGYDMRNGRPRVSQLSETVPQLPVVSAPEVTDASGRSSAAAQGPEVQPPTSASSADAMQNQQAQTLELSGVTGPSLRGEVSADDASFPKHIDTIGGTLEMRRLPDKSSAVLLDNKPLFSGSDAEWQELVQKFQRPDGTDIVLLRSSGGRGTSCEALFFFLLIDKSGLRYTPEFGSCSPEASYQLHADVITMKIPRMGGISSYQLVGDKITEDGKPLSMTDSQDPSK